MRHVDEGDLHAWLDGTRDSGTAARRQDQSAAGFKDGRTAGRQEIEQHLAECAECRDRLEEVRRVRDRAADLLRRGTPGAVRAIPPFDAVLERARARKSSPLGNRPGFRLTSPLAWAATVVLAFGVGWYANRLAGGRAGGQADDSQPKQLAEETLPAPVGPAERGTVVGEARIVQQPEGKASPATPGIVQGARRQIATAEPQARANQPVVDAPMARDEFTREATDQAKVASIPSAAPAPAAAAPMLADRLALRKEADAPAPEAPADAGFAANRLAAASGDEALWRPVDRAAAEAMLGGRVVTIPGGGPPAFYVAREAGSTRVRTLQGLGAGSTVVLLQDRLVAPVAAEARRARSPTAAQSRADVQTDRAVPPGNTVSIEDDGFRLTASGPFPVDSLRVMLERAVKQPVRR